MSLYHIINREVKVDSQVSGDFEVNSGLRQGCVLSPLLFSLYINGVVKRLKEENCGVECGGETILVCCLQTIRAW